MPGLSQPVSTCSNSKLTITTTTTWTDFAQSSNVSISDFGQVSTGYVFVIAQVQHLIGQLVNIQSKLGTYDFKIPAAPSFKPDEFPER